MSGQGDDDQVKMGGNPIVTRKRKVECDSESDSEDEPEYEKNKRRIFYRAKSRLPASDDSKKRCAKALHLLHGIDMLMEAVQKDHQASSDDDPWGREDNLCVVENLCADVKDAVFKQLSKGEADRVSKRHKLDAGKFEKEENMLELHEDAKAGEYRKMDLEGKKRVRDDHQKQLVPLSIFNIVGGEYVVRIRNGVFPSRPVSQPTLVPILDHGEPFVPSSDFKEVTPLQLNAHRGDKYRVRVRVGTSKKPFGSSEPIFGQVPDLSFDATSLTHVVRQPQVSSTVWLYFVSGPDGAEQYLRYGTAKNVCTVPYVDSASLVVLEVTLELKR